MELKEEMKRNNISIDELSKKLNISHQQIYKWFREGISTNNKYFDKIVELMPDVTFIEPKLTKKGLPDNRTNSGRKKKEYSQEIYHSKIPFEHSIEHFESTLFPKIRFKKK